MINRISHIEVTNAKSIPFIEAGQMLKVLKETNCFYWVQAFNGTKIKVSKKTSRGCGTENHFWKEKNQPVFNI